MSKTYDDNYSKMRWFIERNRLALVQFDDTATKEEDKYLNLKLTDSADTYTVRLYGNKIAQHFDADNDILPEIPEQYHEAIVQKAIAWGYEIPPNQELQTAAYFHTMYEDTVKRAKKWKRMGRTGGWGKIVDDNWFNT
tara:strand:+ start:2188 stop:2601 length:414 start_codon:yes stop_codon:yes gene_type:complete